MISKKNKALVAGVLAAAMSASAIVPAMSSAANEYASENNANESYAKMFESLYDDVITNGEDNGYLSKNNKNGNGSFGIPYHAVETLVIEAPDYGHETTSEAMSYIVWMAAMRDVLGANHVLSESNELPKAWQTLEAMIPGWSDASGIKTTVNYASIWKQDRLKADTAPEMDTPEKYPVENAGVDALNPLYNTFKSAYGSDNGYYLMNWLADVDDWYGFGGGTPGAGNGKFVFINTFQRGEEESCFETVPAPCIEELKYGMSGDNGIKAIFNGLGKVPKQYSFTNAPDAEDRAIQAVYFANLWGAKVDSDLIAKAGKMGDQCRNDMFDKYYHKIGCQSITAPSESGNGGQHYLMGWYTAWGGALNNYDWAWQIGCSHSHQFYQNPLAAYGLLKDLSSGMKSDGAKADYTESLKRQLEMYLWLQSANGPFAGGCTNSYRGRYEKYPSGASTFYDMIYVEHPVYADPGSNHWIGNQVWSMQRLAELYYDLKVKKTGDISDVKPGGLSMEEALDTVISRWVEWFEKETIVDGTDPIDGKEWSYAIPASLDWSGQPATWNGTYDPSANSGLTCTITAYGQGDVGCVSSLCNTLIYYAAAKGVPASAAATDDNDSVAAKGLRLANILLSKQWEEGRDEIGISFKDHNGSLKRVFEQEVYIPTYYNGTMPDGSELKNGAKFNTIRKIYEDDPMYKDLKAVYEATGETEGYEYNLHRFWHAGDALMAYGGMALLYPDVTPITEDGPDVKVTKWGDANVDDEVNMGDVVAIMRYQANPDEFSLKPVGKLNADVFNNGDGPTNNDALSIQRYEAGLITNLDPASGQADNFGK